MSQINFADEVLNRVAYQKAVITIFDMVKKGEGIDKNTLIDTSVTVRSYGVDSKHWSIEYWTEEMIFSLDSYNTNV